jgi:hypothetical protein
MIRWLKSMFGAPSPTGPPEMIRTFRPTEPTLSQDCISVAEDGWLIDAKEEQTVRLFEIQEPQVEQCVLTYRARMKSDALAGRAYLEMWCRLPGRGEFFSKGLHQTVTGTTDWAWYEIPFYLKQGQRPDLIKLSVVVEGRGKVWLKDLQLLKTPLKS